MRDEFHDQLIAALPWLRTQAQALIHNQTDADDLVQDAVAQALRARDSFNSGTDFHAWIHRVLRNRYMSLVRQRHENTDFDGLPLGVLQITTAQEDRLELMAQHWAIGRLPAEQREALLMVVLRGLSYEEVAEAIGGAVSTAKSRVFHARRTLQARLLGEAAEAGAATAAGRNTTGHFSRHDEDHRRAIR
jgi:RNA polymerase sigma-70 factor (ECF subfamily)